MATTTKAPMKRAVTNYLVPVDGGTHAMEFEQDFTVPLNIDWSQMQLDALQFNPSGFYCDNSTGQDLTILIVELNFKIIVGAGKILCYQYPGPVGHTVKISGSASAVIVFVDFPVIPFEITAPAP